MRLSPQGGAEFVSVWFLVWCQGISTVTPTLWLNACSSLGKEPLSWLHHSITGETGETLEWSCDLNCEC